MVQFKTLLAASALATGSLAQISDDFEGGWDKAKWTTYAPDCQQGGSISLDTSTGHSGKSSMRVDGGGGYCGHIFFGSTAVPSGDFYVRAWVKTSKALTASHVTFITMPDAAQSANKHLRIGGQSNILMFNREQDDATLPDLSPQGIAASAPLPTGSFQCFEYHIGADGTIETWLNGQSIAGLQAGPKANNPNGAQWMRTAYSPKIKGVYFGWESYGGDTNTFWYDDVAISSTRVGCDGNVENPPPENSSSSSTTKAATLTSSSTLSTSTRTTSTTTAAGPTQTKWGQCGGNGWQGPTICEAGSTCVKNGDWYSQCV